LGQNFAKAFDVKFQDRDGEHKYVWATSWGVSTRLIGGMIMTHSDDNGLVIPPKLAPIQVVLVPIIKNDDQKSQVLLYAEPLITELKKLGVSVKADDRDNFKPGWKFAEHEAQGVPVRIAIGPRDMENGNIEVARRDTLIKEIIPINGASLYISGMLETIQKDMFEAAKKRTSDATRYADTYDEFRELIEEGGFIYAHWDGTPETEARVKDETKATIRCIPLNGDPTPGKCMVTGKPSSQRVLFARSY